MASYPRPSFTSPNAYDAPDLSIISYFSPRAIISPSREIPSLYIRSNSVTLNGAATLFLTTLTLHLPPMISSPFLIWATLLISSRTDV